MAPHSAGGVPDGYHSVNPYIVVAGLDDLIAFLRNVFGGVERGEREIAADGTIRHAEVEIGDSVVMLSEATSAYPPRQSVNFVYVPNVDCARPDTTRPRLGKSSASRSP